MPPLSRHNASRHIFSAPIARSNSDASSRRPDSPPSDILNHSLLSPDFESDALATLSNYDLPTAGDAGAPRRTFRRAKAYAAWRQPKNEPKRGLFSSPDGPEVTPQSAIVLFEKSTIGLSLDTENADGTWSDETTTPARSRTPTPRQTMASTGGTGRTVKRVGFYFSDEDTNDSDDPSTGDRRKELHDEQPGVTLEEREKRSDKFESTPLDEWLQSSVNEKENGAVESENWGAP